MKNVDHYGCLMMGNNVYHVGRCHLYNELKRYYMVEFGFLYLAEILNLQYGYYAIKQFLKLIKIKMENFNKSFDRYNDLHGLKGRDKMTHVELSRLLVDKFISEGKIKEDDREKEVVNFKNMFYRLANDKIDKFKIDLINPTCKILGIDPNYLFNFNKKRNIKRKKNI